MTQKTLRKLWAESMKEAGHEALSEVARSIDRFIEFDGLSIAVCLSPITYREGEKRSAFIDRNIRQIREMFLKLADSRDDENGKLDAHMISMGNVGMIYFTARGDYTQLIEEFPRITYGFPNASMRKLDEDQISYLINEFLALRTQRVETLLAKYDSKHPVMK